MNAGDVIILLIVALCIFFAVRSIVKQRKKGGCSCGCSGCNACPNSMNCNKNE